MKRFALALTMVAALALSARAAQVADPESEGMSSERLGRIGDLVRTYIDRGEITGAVTLVARHGRIVHHEAQGVRDAENGEPMTLDTMFRIASMSKPVAAVAIMMLVEEGKVQLDDPVAEYLPSFTDMRVAVSEAQGGGSRGGRGAAPVFHTVPADRQITVADLLTHTSGVMSGTMSNSVGNQWSSDRHELGLAWVDRLGEAPLEFQPGSRWSYSALAGFDVLSRIVEIASGQSFDQFLENRMFEPLGMSDTTFWPTDRQRQRLVTSYNTTDDGLVARNNPDSMSGERYFSGAGGLMTTAEEYAQFGMMLANGGRATGESGRQLLGSRTLETMRSVWIPDSLPGRGPGEGFGLGVRVIDDPVAASTLLSSGTFGWSGAYGTHFFVDPVEEIVGVMMIQTPIREMRPLFEAAVMQAVID